MNEVGKSKSAGRWFLGKLLRHPASYIGLAAAIGVGLASFPVGMPMGGIIGMSVMVGIAVGMLSFLVGCGVKASHRQALENRSGISGETEANVDPSLRESLREVDEDEVGEVLEKLSQDRNAIARQVGELPEEDEDGKRTLELVSTILAEAVSQAEELQDLARRMRDPLLEAGSDAGARMEAIRGQIGSAYRAVADTRSRLRRGEKLARKDFLEPATSSTLPALTEQLAGETEIARRVEERMRPDFGNVVFDSEREKQEEGSTAEEGSWEKE